jgi:hypothetical protein
MKSGLSLPVQHPPDEPSAQRIRELIVPIRMARDLGFDSISASLHSETMAGPSTPPTMIT